MEQLLLAVFGWLEALGIVDWARGSASVYPWANVLHVLGVVLLVGGIGVVDLRVLGCWRELPLLALSRALTPIAVAGLVLQAGSGLVLFAADGVALAASDTFALKLQLLGLALINAAAFRLHWQRKAVGTGHAPSALERSSALVSLLLWLAIATVGRLIAYY